MVVCAFRASSCDTAPVAAAPVPCRAVSGAASVILLCALLLGVTLAPAVARAGVPVLAVAEIGLVNFSGEGSDAAEDEARGHAVTAAIIREAGEGGNLVVVPLACKGTCNFDAAGVEALRRRAHAAGASHVLVGSVRRIGAAVALLRVSVLDTGSGQMTMDRMLSFRGDSDTGWAYAASFVAREVAEALLPPPAP